MVPMVALCLASEGQLWAEEFNIKPEYYVVKDFKLQSGEVLPEMKIEYGTLGTPQKDSSGDIINAVVWCHGWSGNYLQGTTGHTKIFGKGKPIDPERYFIIFPTALGSLGSSSPSVSGLGPKFPKYTMSDIVAGQYRLITEHFRIKHLLGVAGGSMGWVDGDVDAFKALFCPQRCCAFLSPVWPREDFSDRHLFPHIVFPGDGWA